MTTVRYHLTSDGPKRCVARDAKSCRADSVEGSVSSDHYDSLEDAQSDYEKIMEGSNKGFLNSQSRESERSDTGSLSIQPMKGGSYYGSPVDESDIRSTIDEWRKSVGVESFELEDAKVKRDGGYHFHVTVLDPKETRALKKSGKISEFQKDISEISPEYSTKGVGRVLDGDKEAHYVLVESGSVQSLREKYGLEKKDLHITLGFRNGDVHGLPKDESTRFL